MAAKKNPLADKAYELYRNGTKLVDIADQLGKPEGTIRRWKNTYNWDSERSDSKANESERSEKKKRTVQIVADEGTKETLENADLTAEQQMFCIYYSKSFNATQSYQKAYGCKYETAMVNGCKLLRITKIKKEIERLKEIKRQQILVGEEDIVELQMRIAFGDIGDVVEFGTREVDTGESTETINYLHARPSGCVDTQLIRSITEGRSGLNVIMKDEQKAIDWLTKFFEMNPDDKHRKEFDKRKLELDLIRLEMQTKDKAEEDAAEQDNFLDALNESAKEVWSDG
nr:MAG TPA: Terminase small subunit [Caudoviricetes sp.]